MSRALIMLVPLIVFAGCADRMRLYPKTGAAFSRAFSKQAEDRDIPVPRGLDAIDADIVMRNYRALMIQRGQGGGTGGAQSGGTSGLSGGGIAPTGTLHGGGG